ncbi:thioredoxin domain-containing protein [Novosphingobium sp. ERN07]|uniref:DsbA family protein n=1 Tax=Novosphingobium sp. ERN07 TaxID=2726187 RepID=UPI001456C7B5|nr:thioredoxin domain-containing protein [Novosphingobium sp. ERN07]NLR71091.1 thioredoxin domain-containing protein [Novosphingobium sp. ERN07]
MNRKLATAALATVALLSLTGQTPAAKPKPARPAGGTNWAATASVTPEGYHILGNPKAPLRLVEFVSYTCPHCSAFEVESEGQLKLGMVGPGKGAVEVRNFVRDPVDVTVALITNCLPANRFFQVHTAFMRAQPQWIGPLTNSTAAQRQRWTTGPFSTRTRAIASDFKFYQFMAARGVDRPTLDRCLANEPLANKLAQQTNDAVEKLGVTGTPSFMIDGVLLAGTHNWDALRPQILARTK